MVLLNKFILVVCFFALIIIGQNSRAETGDAGAGIEKFPQQYIVKGNKIVDESGDEMIFRGVNAEDPVWQGSELDPDIGIWKEENFKVMREWGATLVRLPIHPATWRKLGVDKSFGFIDQAIAWAEKFNMYVIIDFHSIGFMPENDFMDLRDFEFGQLYETTREEMFEFWDLVSKRYFNNDVVVFYELFNEPALDSVLDFPAEFTIDDWLVWKKFNEDVIDAIRINDPDKAVIVSGFQFAYDLSFVPDAPIERPNVVYATHPYPDANWKTDWDKAFGNVKADFPVIATELGFDSDEKPEEIFNDNGGKGLYRDEIMSFLEDKKISWTAWAFSHAFTPALLLDLDFTPSESGEFFRKIMLKHADITEAPTPTLSPTSTPEPTPTPDVGGKSFTFKCNKDLQVGFADIERLNLRLGENEHCVLKLTNLESGLPVEISSRLRKGLLPTIKIEPPRSITDANGEIEITITAIRKGIDWAEWTAPNDRGQFKFNKQSYDKGLAWGMFVEVK